jgi:hypothetical protein
MGKFINTVQFIEDKEYNSQLDFDMDVLSSTVIYMQDYYENIFTGLNNMIKACNDAQKRVDPINQ